jgi:hypothetical protein
MMVSSMSPKDKTSQATNNPKSNLSFFMFRMMFDCNSRTESVKTNKLKMNLNKINMMYVSNGMDRWLVVEDYVLVL